MSHASGTGRRVRTASRLLLVTARMKGLVASSVPKAEDAVIDGDLVVYFHDDDSVAHAGFVQGELVRSKWASERAVWDHGVWEVPFGYGASVQYYEADEAKHAL
jgi:hypothetical protein